MAGVGVMTASAVRATEVATTNQVATEVATTNQVVS